MCMNELGFVHNMCATVGGCGRLQLQRKEGTIFSATYR